MNLFHGLTWQELSDKINTMTDEQKSEGVAIFVFGNGELEMANGVFHLGRNPELEYNCDDFDLRFRNSIKCEGYPYLLCGYYNKKESQKCVA